MDTEITEVFFFFCLELELWLSVWTCPSERCHEEIKNEDISFPALWPDFEWCLRGSLGHSFWRWPWGCQNSAERQTMDYVLSESCCWLTLISDMFFICSDRRYMDLLHYFLGKHFPSRSLLSTYNHIAGSSSHPTQTRTYVFFIIQKSEYLWPHSYRLLDWWLLKHIV